MPAIRFLTLARFTGLALRFAERRLFERIRSLLDASATYETIRPHQDKPAVKTVQRLREPREKLIRDVPHVTSHESDPLFERVRKNTG
jgi:hypothetical protein